MKKMPKILILTIILISSCSEDFLNKPLYNELNTSIFWKTEEDAKAALMAAYEATAWYFETPVTTGGVYGGWLYRLDYSAVDLSHPGGFTGPTAWEPVYDYTFTSSTAPMFRALWVGHYIVIQRANQVIVSLPEMDIDENEKSRMISEAMFLRALMYHNLVQLWGDVPYLDYLPSGDKLYAPRTSQLEVYDHIINDLETAIPNLPLSWSGTDLGRATEGAARLLLAKVFLSRGGYLVDVASGEWLKERDASSSENWGKALDYSQSVIDMGKYNLWQDEDLGSGRLLGAIPEQAKNADKIRNGYQAAFWCENDGDLVNGESLFEIQYVSYWPGRWNAGSLMQEGSNINDFDIPATVNNYGGVVHNGYTSNFPLQGLIDSYEPGDKRKEATLLAPGDTLWLRQWSDQLPNQEGYFVWNGDQGSYGSSFGSAGYMCSKWVWGYTDERESSPVNYKVLRYADAYLIKAEALNEMGRTSEAYEPLNIIRRRAGLPELSGLTQPELRDRIYLERKLEFAFEINRYFDAKRSGKLAEWVENDRGLSIPRYKFLLPIPQEALDLDPELVQNFGY